MQTLEDRICAAFSGIVLGDSLGESVEGLPSAAPVGEKIVQLASAWEPFPDPARITYTLALKKRIWDDAVLAGVNPGWTIFIPDRVPFVTTDDSFLNGLVAQSMARMCGWDLRDQVQTHIKGLSGRADAWGPTIRAGVEDLRDGKRAIGEPAPRSLDPKRPGIGNGPMMRSVPLGVWSALRPQDNGQDLLRECFELGFMSHWDIRASIAAFAYARYLEMLLRHSGPVSRGSAQAMLVGILHDVTEAEKFARERFPNNQPVDSSVNISDRICDLVITNTTSYEGVAALWGTEGNSLITAPYVLGMMTHVLSQNEEPHLALVAAVHAGEDTDTNAALLGALLGAYFGWDAFPKEWVKYPAIQEDMSLIQGVAAELHVAAQR